MNKESLLNEIKECFVNLSGVDKVRELVKKALDYNIEPKELINSMKEGLDEVGKKYERSECFLSDLIMAGIMATELVNIIKPTLEGGKFRPKARIVIGTVKGDIHDIGKNIVASLLSSQGFEVIDIGVDVSPEKFLESLEKYRPDILAMSCLLTIGMEEMHKTVKLVKSKNLKVKTMVGGRPITQNFADEIGADGYGKDAFEAINVANRLIGE